jgi:hypothetical protein
VHVRSSSSSPVPPNLTNTVDHLGGSVTLQSNNPFDPPLINPNFIGNDFDVALLREGVKSAQRLVTLGSTFHGYIISSLHNMTTDDEIDDFMRTTLAGFSHPVSTCAMSPKGAQFGVVDPDLTLKGAVGLRVVDASVLVSAVVDFGDDVWRSLLMCTVFLGFLAVYAGCAYAGFGLCCCGESVGFD